MIRGAGYGDWVLFMCDDDDDDFSVNHIYVDDDGDICLKSTEEGGYEFTANNVLNRLKHYDNESYVYFVEEYDDGSSNVYDIDFHWFIGANDDGDDILNIDCSPCDDEDDDYYDSFKATTTCPFCGSTQLEGKPCKCGWISG